VLILEHDMVDKLRMCGRTGKSTRSGPRLIEDKETCKGHISRLSWALSIKGFKPLTRTPATSKTQEVALQYS